ncbi:MAG: RNA polymerase sigma factor [Pseudomonadota bacterium]
MVSTTSALELLRNGSIKQYAARLLKSDSDADDVLQIVAEKMLSNVSTIREPENYVRRAVRNAAFDYQRAAKIRENYENRTSLPPESVEHDAEADLVLEELEQVLSRLPTLTAQMFRMHYVDGLTQTQIAMHFSVHVSNVEKRIAKAKRACLVELTSIR